MVAAVAMHRWVMRPLVVLGVVVGTGALAVGPGAAKTAPAVPTEARAQAIALLQEIGGKDLSFFPTRLPSRFTFQSYSVTGTPLDLDLAFVDGRFTSNAKKILQHEIAFDVGYLGKKVCSSGS